MNRGQMTHSQPKRVSGQASPVSWLSTCQLATHLSDVKFIVVEEVAEEGTEGGGRTGIVLF